VGLRGYSFDLWLAAAMESLLFSLAFIWPVAALAALTKDLPRFFIAASCVAGECSDGRRSLKCSCASAGCPNPSYGNNQLRSRPAPRPSPFPDHPFRAGGLVVAVPHGRTRPGIGVLVAGLLAFYPALTLWPKNFLAPREIVPPPLTVSPVEDAAQLAARPQSQLLWSHFFVDDLPDRHLALVQGLSLNFKPKGGRGSRSFSDYTD